ncbi:MAG: class I SAM-dependent methyltransferase [Gammaproteobacteria bacterium]|nr:class I SAM-dependent methyltransferase [Gammaproteobacteria bacterium]
MHGGTPSNLPRPRPGEHRTEANRARDGFRHPIETLTFFGVTPTSSVVEVWPGGGWYTEILAPYLRTGGVYFAAGFAMTLADAPEFFSNAQRALANKLASNAVYDHVVLTELSAPERAVMAPPGSADFVLTFRNVHNWFARGNADAMMAAFNRALKPGGVLGIVEHRAKPGTADEVMKKSGYMTEQYVIDLAAKHGFTLAARSEINANAKDSTDHPAGVWTLPPNLRHCQPMADGPDKSACIATYTAIGESDRMTLKFVKAG